MLLEASINNSCAFTVTGFGYRYKRKLWPIEPMKLYIYDYLSKITKVLDMLFHTLVSSLASGAFIDKKLQSIFDKTHPSVAVVKCLPGQPGTQYLVAVDSVKERIYGKSLASPLSARRMTDPEPSDDLERRLAADECWLEV